VNLAYGPYVIALERRSHVPAPPNDERPLRMFMTEPEAVRRPSDEAAPGARGVRPLTFTGQRAGPDQLCGYIAELRIGSLGGVGEDGECLVSLILCRSIKCLCLFDRGARHHHDAQLSEILAGPGRCLPAS
jgi:hypothetical protein